MPLKLRKVPPNKNGAISVNSTCNKNRLAHIIIVCLIKKHSFRVSYDTHTTGTSKLQDPIVSVANLHKITNQLFYQKLSLVIKVVCINHTCLSVTAAYGRAGEWEREEAIAQEVRARRICSAAPRQSTETSTLSTRDE